MRISAPGTILDDAPAFLYDGTFHLAILAPGETVAAVPGTADCEVRTAVGTLRLTPGDWVARTDRGLARLEGFDPAAGPISVAPAPLQ